VKNCFRAYSGFSGGFSLLFAIKYRPQPGRTDADAKRVRALLIKWQAPPGVEVKNHYHYVSGGGVLIVDTLDPSLLYETLGPFKPLVEFDVEPVINFVEALAISTDVDEWVASASAASFGNTDRA